MQKTKKIEQLKAIYRLKIILSILKEDIQEIERYNRIIDSLDYLDKEMKKYRTIGDN